LAANSLPIAGMAFVTDESRGDSRKGAAQPKGGMCPSVKGLAPK